MDLLINYLTTHLSRVKEEFSQLNQVENLISLPLTSPAVEVNVLNFSEPILPFQGRVKIQNRTCSIYTENAIPFGEAWGFFQITFKQPFGNYEVGETLKFLVVRLSKTPGIGSWILLTEKAFDRQKISLKIRHEFYQGKYPRQIFVIQLSFKEDANSEQPIFYDNPRDPFLCTIFQTLKNSPLMETFLTY